MIERWRVYTELQTTFAGWIFSMEQKSFPCNSSSSGITIIVVTIITHVIIVAVAVVIILYSTVVFSSVGCRLSSFIRAPNCLLLDYYYYYYYYYCCCCYCSCHNLRGCTVASYSRRDMTWRCLLCGDWFFRCDASRWHVTSRHVTSRHVRSNQITGGGAIVISLYRLVEREKER